MFIDQPRLSRRGIEGSQLGQVVGFPRPLLLSLAWHNLLSYPHSPTTKITAFTAPASLHLIPALRTQLTLSKIAGSIIVGIAVIVIGYYSLRSFRRNHSKPTYLPTAYLKRKWIHWDVPQFRMTRTDAAHLEPITSNSTAGPFRSQPPSTGDSSAILSAPFATPSGSNPNAASSAASAIDRNTSVRSIATLPEYAFYAKPTEQVLGRAGERDGIDTVVKFPDIAEAAEEERREDEMEALYQVRLARRNEIAAREERRRLRREARDRGDLDALAELRTRGRAESNTNLDALRAEHSRLRERERAVSQVSYEGLGVAHLDGSRVRANSEESERPLLGDAGDMGGGGAAGRASMGSFSTFDNTARYSERYSEDDPGRPPMYDEISLGAGRDVPPGYMPSAHASGGNSPRTRPDLSLGSHPVTELDLGVGHGSAPLPTIERRASASPPIPFPNLEDGYDTDDAAELNNNSGSGASNSGAAAAVVENTSNSRRASATFIDPVAQRRLSPSPGRRVSPPRHIQLPRSASFPVVATEGGLTPPSQSPSPTPPGAAPGNASGGSSGAASATEDPAPRRMSTLARRRISVNDLMGTVGRAAESVVPQKTTYVLHTPPIPSSTTPPLGDRRRSSFMGLPRLGGGGGGNGGPAPGGLGVGPSIVVESATPVVGPGGRGRGALGWENERAGG